MENNPVLFFRCIVCREEHPVETPGEMVDPVCPACRSRPLAALDKVLNQTERVNSSRDYDWWE